MISRFRTLFAPRPSRIAPASIPAGQRVYAVGDIHGRLDLFNQLVAMIETDDAQRGPAETTVVLLGDLVDRGPDSRGVIAAARAWQARRKVRILAGNHEQMFLDSFSRTDSLRNFIRHGGKETLLSYGIARDVYDAATLEELIALMPQFVPAEDTAFIRAMENHVAIGDYLFVHAGIRPGIAVEAQTPTDLRWIRGEFLEDGRDHGFVVVHGHTITDDVVVRHNRIGIDTGAYFSGALTALGLEGAERWFLSTSSPDKGTRDPRGNAE